MFEVFPSPVNTTVHFAHVAYRMEERYALRDPEVNYFQTWTSEETMRRIDDADVFVESGTLSYTHLTMPTIWSV